MRNAVRGLLAALAIAMVVLLPVAPAAASPTPTPSATSSATEPALVCTALPQVASTAAAENAVQHGGTELQHGHYVVVRDAAHPNGIVCGREEPSGPNTKLLIIAFVVVFFGGFGLGMALVNGAVRRKLS